MGVRVLPPDTMRPTKALGDASRPPASDPGTSLLLIAAVLASLVAVSHPVYTAGLAVLVASAYALARTVHLSGDGYLCVPKLDRCYRIKPT